jgi:23S rRNA (cytosine1962-C5)-methyltransferase
MASEPDNEYELLDSGEGRKLERFGPVVLDRPCGQAVWAPDRPELWRAADARFSRKGGLEWRGRERLPEAWTVRINGIRLKLSTTDFGHLGVFPETRSLWDELAAALREDAAGRGEAPAFLNLFAYSGAATLAAAAAGARCCHVDAARGMVQWARENAALNGLGEAPVRWIVDDVNKFLQREIRRGRRYEAVLLDPPSFGRGRGGELYKIERDVLDTLEHVGEVLAERPAFVHLTSHTPGFTPVVLENLLRQVLPPGRIQSGEMLLTGAPGVFPVPSGTWARASFGANA